MIKEYNKMTKRLLLEGYTAEHHPENVRVATGCFGGDKLNNFYGGFVYKHDFIWKQTFETPCGLQCKGSSAMNGMYYRGINWEFEDDMATVHCPYRKRECQLKHEYLRNTGNPHTDLMCNVHMTSKPYCFQGSIEDLKEQHEAHRVEAKKAFIASKKGRACDRHMSYNDDTGQWSMKYDPVTCAYMRCRGYCPILGRDLDKKRGNVFYDVKTEGRDYSKDGTLFEGERFTRIIKGKRAFDKPISMDICQIYANQCQDDLRFRVQGKAEFSRMLFMARIHNLDWHMEIINIRAEQRESRDLEQDLQDIADGIKITYSSDDEKLLKQKKKERTEAAKRKRIEKLEKKILDVGFAELDTIDKRQAEKWIEVDRLNELEEIRQKKAEEKKNEPRQISLFDMMGGDRNGC